MHDIVFVPIGYLTKIVAWKKWLHHVVKKLRNWEVKEGAIVCKNGYVIAASQQFHINMNEFKVRLCYDNNHHHYHRPPPPPCRRRHRLTSPFHADGSWMV